MLTYDQIEEHEAMNDDADKHVKAVIITVAETDEEKAEAQKKIFEAFMFAKLFWNPNVKPKA